MSTDALIQWRAGACAWQGDGRSKRCEQLLHLSTTVYSLKHSPGAGASCGLNCAKREIVEWTHTTLLNNPDLLQVANDSVEVMHER